MALLTLHLSVIQTQPSYKLGSQLTLAECAITHGMETDAHLHKICAPLRQLTFYV